MDDKHGSMNDIDYSKGLGVAANAIEKESKRAYQQATQSDHPDKNTNDKLAQQRVNKVCRVPGNGCHAKCSQPATNEYWSRLTGGNSAGFDFAIWFGVDAPSFQWSPMYYVGGLFSLGAKQLPISTRKQQGIL